jgi:protoporphyrinogen/coproporphyrinogen III oxidase
MESSQPAAAAAGAVRTAPHHVPPGDPQDTGPLRAVVIGGGISGLAAALRLTAGGARVTLLEAGPRLGGKLLAGEIAGAPVDLGAESLLARRPEAVELARSAGIGDRLTAPATATAAVWTRGALRPMPQGHVMGVPAEPESLAGLLTPEGVARIAREAELPPARIGDDAAIGTLVAERLGPEVVDRLVEPLLGGVYAGDARSLSLRASVPALYEALRARGRLLDAVRDVQERAAANRPAGPAFLGIEGGVGTLPAAVAGAVRAAGGEILTGTPVLGLARESGNWRVRTPDRVLTADAVVIAAPAAPAARLLAPVCPDAAAELDRIDYASMALITLAYRSEDAAVLPEGSGFLVPSAEGRTIKASTFSTRKWGWVDKGAPDLFVLRTSIGRYGDDKLLDRDDAELVAHSRTDLAAATGLTARPVATVVTRWDDGLPQYPVGHHTRTARIRAAVAALPGLAVCGAAFDGVGIPACAADARRAADAILTTAPRRPGGDTGAGE